MAWQLFADAPPGWARVQGICDWVHSHLRFDYGLAVPWLAVYRLVMRAARRYAKLDAPDGDQR